MSFTKRIVNGKLIYTKYKQGISELVKYLTADAVFVSPGTWASVVVELFNKNEKEFFTAVSQGCAQIDYLKELEKILSEKDAAPGTGIELQNVKETLNKFLE